MRSTRKAEYTPLVLEHVELRDRGHPLLPRYVQYVIP